MSIIDEFRIVLPQAAGIALSDRQLHRIVDDTLSQGLDRADRKDHDWLNAASNRNALLLCAFIYGEGQRKFGGLLLATHPVGVAHLMANFQPLRDCGYDPATTAFLGLIHDLAEDYRPRKSRVAVMPSSEEAAAMDAAVFRMIEKCWVGTASEWPSLQRDMLAFTDSYGLSDEAVAQEQINRARGVDTNGMNYSERVTVGRFADKWHSTYSDMGLVKSNKISDPAAIEERATLAEKKVLMVNSLRAPIRASDKNAFRALPHIMRGHLAKKTPAISEKRPAGGPSGMIAFAASTASLH